MSKINEAAANQQLTLDAVEVVEKGEVREFSRFGKLGRVCTAKITDDSGDMELTLWNEEVDAVAEGDKVKLSDGWCKEWNGKLQVSTGKNGKLEKL